MSVLDDWARVQDRFTAAMEFIEFLESRGIGLDFERAPVGTRLDLRQHAYDFVQIDPQALERARLEVLSEARRHIKPLGGPFQPPKKDAHHGYSACPEQPKKPKLTIYHGILRLGRDVPCTVVARSRAHGTRLLKEIGYGHRKNEVPSDYWSDGDGLWPAEFRNAGPGVYVVPPGNHPREFADWTLLSAPVDLDQWRQTHV